MNTVILFVLLFGFMLLGMPIAIALGLSSLLTILLFGQDSMASLALKLFETSEHFTLLAIPFFILSGAFMTTGGVAKRMIRFANACIGHLRGGLAMASVMACMLFAAVSGSSPATVVAVGSIVIAGMVRNGYTKEFAAGVICNAGTLGILIPPYRHGGLCGGNRNLGRQAVHGRCHSRHRSWADADGRDLLSRPLSEHSAPATCVGTRDADR